MQYISKRISLGVNGDGVSYNFDGIGRAVPTIPGLAKFARVLNDNPLASFAESGLVATTGNDLDEISFILFDAATQLSKWLLRDIGDLVTGDDSNVICLTATHSAEQPCMIPIELLATPDQIRLGLHPRLAVANEVSTNTKINQRTGAGQQKLRALIVSDPGTGPDFKAAQKTVRNRFLEDLRQVAADYGDRFEVDHLGSGGRAASLDQIRNLQGSYDVIELWAHGQSAAEELDRTGSPKLFLGDSWVDFECVSDVLLQLQPRLVLLRSCESGRGTVRSFAARLQAAGVPAVVGMRTSVGVHETATFLSAFRRTLVKGLRTGAPIQQVVQMARIAYNSAFPSAMRWFDPVLWVHPELTTGVIFPELVEPESAEEFARAWTKIRLGKIDGAYFEGSNTGDVDVHVDEIRNSYFVGKRGIDGGNVNLDIRDVTNTILISRSQITNREEEVRAITSAMEILAKSFPGIGPQGLSGNTGIANAGPANSTPKAIERGPTRDWDELSLAVLELSAKLKG